MTKIERLQADKTAISQTASDYLHEIERLRAELAAERERSMKLLREDEVAVRAERERCVRVIETILRNDDKAKVAFLVAVIRKGE